MKYLCIFLNHIVLLLFLIGCDSSSEEQSIQTDFAQTEDAGIENREFYIHTGAGVLFGNDFGTIDENHILIDGDIIFPREQLIFVKDQKLALQKFELISSINPTHFWKDSQVNLSFKEFSAADVKTLMGYFKDWEKSPDGNPTGIKVVNITGKEANYYVEVPNGPDSTRRIKNYTEVFRTATKCGPNAGGCATYGPGGFLATSMNSGTAKHELGHTLGVMHEHMHYDRDRVLDLSNHQSKVGKHNFVKFHDRSSAYGRPLDLKSIMIYSGIKILPEYQYRKNGRLQTKTEWTNNLSSGDYYGAVQLANKEKRLNPDLSKIQLEHGEVKITQMNSLQFIVVPLPSFSILPGGFIEYEMTKNGQFYQDSVTNMSYILRPSEPGNYQFTYRLCYPYQIPPGSSPRVDSFYKSQLAKKCRNAPNFSFENPNLIVYHPKDVEEAKLVFGSIKEEMVNSQKVALDFISSLSSLCRGDFSSSFVQDGLSQLRSLTQQASQFFSYVEIENLIYSHLNQDRIDTCPNSAQNQAAMNGSLDKFTATLKKLVEGYKGRGQKFARLLSRQCGDGKVFVKDKCITELSTGFCTGNGDSPDCKCLNGHTKDSNGICISKNKQFDCDDSLPSFEAYSTYFPPCVKKVCQKSFEQESAMQREAKLASCCREFAISQGSLFRREWQPEYCWYYPVKDPLRVHEW